MEQHSSSRRLRQFSRARTRNCLDNRPCRIAHQKSMYPPFGKHIQRASPFLGLDRHMNQKLTSCGEQRNDTRILIEKYRSFRMKDWLRLPRERNKTDYCTTQKLQPNDQDSGIQTVPFSLSPQIFRKGRKEKTVRALDQSNSPSCPLSFLWRRHNRSSGMLDLSNPRNVAPPKWCHM